MANSKYVDKKYNVSICAIFKNESYYLREWLEFNHLVGVEHFYLYNNNSEDDYLRVLNPYIKKGLVTLIDWPHNQKQMESYIDCINNYSSESKWIGFIDIDEFIVPNLLTYAQKDLELEKLAKYTINVRNKKKSTIEDEIKKCLEEYCEHK